MPQTRPAGPPLTSPDSKLLEGNQSVLQYLCLDTYFATDSHDERIVSDSERIESDPKLLYEYRVNFASLPCCGDRRADLLPNVSYLTSTSTHHHDNPHQSLNERATHSLEQT